MRNAVAGIILFAVSGTALPNYAFAKEPTILNPSSKWVVNYADDSCRLARAFGTGNAQVLLMFDRFRPGPALNATLIGRPVRAPVGEGKVIFQFSEQGAEQKRSFATGEMENKLPAIMVNGALRAVAKPTSPDVSDEEAEAQAEDPGKLSPEEMRSRADGISFIDVRVAGRSSLRLQTGKMGAPLEALSQCTSNLIKGWGIDAEAHQSLMRPAMPAENPRDWLSSGDYPAAMRWTGQQAIVRFRLIVDEAGQPKSCHIQQSTRPEDFDKAVCKGIMRRASFHPALDAAGKPIASYYVNRVRFKI